MKILLINGGRGAKQLIPFLTKNKNFEVTSLVNAYDDGKSTGELRKYFNTLGPSDIRKVHQLFLNKKDKNYKFLLKVFNFRFDNNINRISALEQLESKNFFSQDLKINFNKFNNKYKKKFSECIDYIVKKFKRDKHKDFNFADCSLMNLIYVASILKENLTISETINFFNNFLPLNGNVIVNSNDNKYLVAKRENGEIIDNEEKIVNFRSNIRISDLFLFSNKKNIFKKIKTKNTLSYLPNISKEAKFHLKNSDIIIYCPGTQHSSLYPSYMTRDFCDEIIKNKKCLKIIITNIGEDYETPSFNASDYIKYSYKYLTLNYEREVKYSSLFDYAFINLPNKIKKNFVPVDYFNLDNIKIKKIIKNFSKKNDLGQHDGKKVINEILKLINE